MSLYPKYNPYTYFNAGDAVIIANGEVIGGAMKYYYDIDDKNNGTFALESIISGNNLPLPDGTVVLVILANEYGNHVYQSFIIKSLLSSSSKIYIDKNIVICKNSYMGTLLNHFITIPNNVVNMTKEEFISLRKEMKKNNKDIFPDKENIPISLPHKLYLKLMSNYLANKI